MKDLQVIGVVHSATYQLYEETMRYLKERIQPSMRIAFESPRELGDIPWYVQTTQDPTAWFLGNMLVHIQRNGAQPLPVEDKRAFEQTHHRIRELEKKGWKRREIFENDWLFSCLTQYRSVRHLELAREKDADILIVGAAHAYDLSSWGHPKVTYATPLTNELIRRAHFQRHHKWSKKLAERARKSF